MRTHRRPNPLDSADGPFAGVVDRNRFHSRRDPHLLLTAPGMILSRRFRFLALAVSLVLLLVGGIVVYWQLSYDPGDRRLRAFVHARPPVAVVFTSRTEPASLVAAAPEGEGFTAPGQRLWAAREGRLRLLTPRGTVHELTWGKPLPDGSTLIDVMSPSVSLDGQRILFAGRKGGEDAGRFRLYEIGIDGTGLRALTGGPDDEGCVDLPPMRWRGDGSAIPDAERRRPITTMSIPLS